MAILRSRFSLLSISLTGALLASGTQSIPAFVNELEHLLVDAAGYNDAGFKAGVTPCSIYNQGAQTTGRQSSAQWLRLAFHDFATHNATAGTGGIDGSIGFETDREENHGAAMNDSLTFFAPFVNKYASMADMIALGSVVAIGSCNGPLIDFAGGRIDATGGGASGVPEPQDPLTVHIAEFANAGMNQKEMIQLTACGHTIGSVHQAGFPDIVQGTETPNNTNGGVHFDDTVDVFDNHVVTQYLQNGGAASTNELVVTFNVTDRSDLRIFNSDGNATMKTLADPNAFSSVCKTIIKKMLDSVPRDVSLVPVSPFAIKPVNVQLAVSKSGTVTFSGAIRLLSSAGFPLNLQRNVQVTWASRDGSACKSCSTTATFNPNTTVGSSLFGDTYYYLFSTTINAQTGISAYTVSIRESANAKSKTSQFVFEDLVAWQSSFSSLSLTSSGSVIGTIASAVRTSPRPSNVQAELFVPVPQIGAKNPKVTSFNIPLSPSTVLGNSGYTLYTSKPNAVIPGVTNMTVALRSTVDIVATIGGHSVTDDFRKLAVLGGTSS